MLLFAYGTLMDAEVRALVLGRPAPEATPASLRGWRRVRVPGEAYPALAPDPQATVAGLLVELHGAAELDRLRFFEGKYYEMRECAVESLRGPATAWLSLPLDDHPWEEGGWDLASWSPHREAYLQATEAYMAAYGAVDLDHIHLIWQAYGHGRAKQG